MSSNYYPFFLKTVFCYRLFLPEKQWESGTAAIFMTWVVLVAISLPQLTNATMVAQTPLVQSQCTDVEINKHIQQLNKGEIADFNALVACNSKAVPVLIKGLGNQDEAFRIPTIAALGEIGSKAAPAVPFLNASLKDKNRDVRIIAVQALRKIGQDPIPPLINALKDDNWYVRYKAADTLGQIGREDDAVLYLNTALEDIDSMVRSAAANALEKIKKAYPQQEIKEYYSPCRRSSFLGLRVDCSIREDAPFIRENLKLNPPVMCKIPIIKAVLRWKCPSVQRVNNNGK